MIDSRFNRYVPNPEFEASIDVAFVRVSMEIQYMPATTKYAYDNTVLPYNHGQT